MGTLGVLEVEPRSITADQVATLEDLAAMAMAELDLLAATTLLTAPLG